ncbi:MAG: HIT domain-containing protein [Propionibacteriaceae bacterium]|jgi:histidine triad (HIT) family protein|nr:HIT domain-containing protein [Propionibacteriaceae bacterium]
MSDCLFCKIVAGEIPSSQVFADETAVGFLDIEPLHRGHTLLVPRRHVADGLTDPSVWDELAVGLVSVGQRLRAALGATGINILSNAGADAGQSVFHFHVHLIPRYPDHPGMADLMTRDARAEDLSQLAALIRG